MSTTPPWRDALRRAAGTAQVLRAVSAGSAGTSSAARGIPSSFAPSTVSPRLAELIAERERLQAGVAAHTGGGTADPRYAVAPMSHRRAEFARWSDIRNSRNPQPNPATPSLRPTPAITDPALRATPGESIPSGSVPTDPRQWMAARDAAGERVGVVRDAAASWRDIGRALRAVGDAGNHNASPGALESLASSGAERPRLAGYEQGDPLERRLARARDLVSRSRKAGAAAQRALDKARTAIPDDWVERARERIPGLGRADPYIRESARKLSVVVGTIDELTTKADQLREMAQSVRELQEADATNDDARRDRALDRLKARRAEGDG